VSPLLGKAKHQMHAEADYLAKAQHLARFGALLAGSDTLVLPELHTPCAPRRFWR